MTYTLFELGDTSLLTENEIFSVRSLVAEGKE